MGVVRARWSSSTFLLYAGTLVVLASAIALLVVLSADYGRGAFFGWSALVFVLAAAVAGAYRRAGQPLVAGLFAFVTVVVFAVFAGSFLDLIGLLDLDQGPIEGFDVGRLLLYLATAVAAFSLLGRFHFPLLVLPAALFAWLFVVDLLSGGGGWTAVLAILIGLLYVMIGVAADGPYGFWVHVLAGLSIGIGILYFWHQAGWEWILVAVVALLYVALAGGLERSSYAVLGAAGLAAAWTHFVEDWAGANPDPLSEQVDTGNGVLRAVLYGLYGLFLVLLGIWLQRRRRVEPQV